MRNWLEPGLSKEEIDERLNRRYGKKRNDYCYRIRTCDDLPQKVWEGSPTQWVAESYVRRVLLNKSANESGRPVIMQRRRCKIIPTPLPPRPAPIKPDVGETILIQGDWEDYGEIVRPSHTD